MIHTRLLAIIAFLCTSDAFAPFFLPRAPTVILYGTKRRGKLGNNIALNEEGKIYKVMTKKEKQKLGSSKMKRGDKEKGSEISPLLAEWAKADDDAPLNESAASTSVSYTETANVFTPFDEEEDTSRGKKRRKTNSIPATTSLNAVKVDAILSNIEEMLSTPNCDIPKLLSQITSLIDMQSQTTPPLKSILSKKPIKDEKQPTYRLAWAGSDRAICHIGTALHKVPLARLQEIFLCLGYNRWELLEVIRILGPFPNVRNTLNGDVKLIKGKGSGFSDSGVAASSDGSGREAVRMNIAYNSMIDGTGKEILAGKATNVKYVDLDVWFANEKAIVCTIVNEDLDGEVMADPLMSGNGEKVLLFVAEENLDESLEKLRAA
jgi:hypothetical protein